MYKRQVHEAANGIAGFPNAAMTVIPAGTGNDFLKNFGPDAVKFSDPEHLWDGQMKNNMNYKRFRHFGKDKVFMDFAFFAIAFMYRH